MIRARRSRVARLGASLGLLLHALVPSAAALAGPERAPEAIEIRQGELDDDERLSPADIDAIAHVLQSNQAYLGAPPFDFCRRLPKAERDGCLADVEAVRQSGIAGAVEVTEVSDLAEGGNDWPNAEAVSDFRRVRVSVPLSKGNRRTEHEANLVTFRSKRGDADERCVFPLEHWSWSEMDRPERFSHAPRGLCGDRTLTVGDYLLEQAPKATPVVLRFLSEPEAHAWNAHDPERIKWDSPYTAGHPYAKYFLLDSLRWWRGGGGKRARNAGYAYAVRFESLPLSRIHALEKKGDVFLDIFEDGAQIELTNVTKAGLEALLAEKPAVLIDASDPDASAPDFQPLTD